MRWSLAEAVSAGQQLPVGFSGQAMTAKRHDSPRQFPPPLIQPIAGDLRPLVDDDNGESIPHHLVVDWEGATADDGHSQHHQGLHSLRRVDRCPQGRHEEAVPRKLSPPAPRWNGPDLHPHLECSARRAPCSGRLPAPSRLQLDGVPRETPILVDLLYVGPEGAPRCQNAPRLGRSADVRGGDGGSRRLHGASAEVHLRQPARVGQDPIDLQVLALEEDRPEVDLELSNRCLASGARAGRRTAAQRFGRCELGGSTQH
mmetsp:Transcript_126456/g.369466  ORF Transcript_126456/g.369466 Transcript_126456/m.369466 type:complete len:258 (+) Transcript_126456:33-806(+)